MIIEVGELDFGHYCPAQLAAVRPDMERLANIMRHNLRLLDGVLGVEPDRPDLARDLEGLRWELHEARALANAQRDDLDRARARIADLEGRVAELQDDEEDVLFGSVGLTASAHAVVVSAARRALLEYFHPDRVASSEKVRATANFQAASAAFDRIKNLRGC